MARNWRDFPVAQNWTYFRQMVLQRNVYINLELDFRILENETWLLYLDLYLHIELDSIFTLIILWLQD